MHSSAHFEIFNWIPKSFSPWKTWPKCLLRPSAVCKNIKISSRHPKQESRSHSAEKAELRYRGQQFQREIQKVQKEWRVQFLGYRLRELVLHGKLELYTNEKSCKCGIGYRSRDGFRIQLNKIADLAYDDLFVTYNGEYQRL